MQHLTRNALIASAVVLLHGAALWTLQGGLLRQRRELVVPVQLEAELETPQPLAQRAPPTPAAPLPPAQPAVASTAVATQAPRSHGAPPAASHEPRPAPAPSAATRSSRHHPFPVQAPAPEPALAPLAPATAPAPAAALAPTATPDAAPAATAAPPTSIAAAAAPGAAAAGGSASRQVELPLSDADYLHNPAPKWPRLSERLGEHGRVLVHVLIGSDGRPRSAQVKESSGYRRLDDASVEAVMGWRYVPGKRGGVPQEMWVDVPIRWGE